jgi:hypothetical protein
MSYRMKKSTEASMRPQSDHSKLVLTKSTRNFDSQPGAQTFTAEPIELGQQTVEQASQHELPPRQRNENGHWLPGVSGNPGGRLNKRPITAALQAYISSKEGQKAILKAVRSQVRVSQYQPGMAVYIRETLEGKLVERMEVQGGLELSARIRRARQRLAEADNTEEYGENE